MPEIDTPNVWVVRHGQTEWSAAGRHTSITDLPLLLEGVADARALAPRLVEIGFTRVISSPRLRARDTARLAGFPDPEIDERLAEWAYGDYEGVTTATIRETVPGWTVFTHPTPNGETAEQIGSRIDALIADVRSETGPVLLIAHGHSLRVLTARWLGLPVAAGNNFVLATATISVLGWEKGQPALERWNA